MSKFTTFMTSSAASQSDSDVVQPQHGLAPLVRQLNAQGGDASDAIRFFPGAQKGKTTVLNAVVANDDAAILVGDAAAGNQLNGDDVAAADFVLIHLDTGGFELMEITSVNGGAAVGEIDITGFTPFDAADEPSAAVAAGSTCYVVLAEDVASITLGTGTLDQRLPFVGNVGAPLGISCDGNAAAQHDCSGTIEYVDNSISRV